MLIAPPGMKVPLPTAQDWSAPSAIALFSVIVRFGVEAIPCSPSVSVLPELKVTLPPGSAVNAIPNQLRSPPKE